MRLGALVVILFAVGCSTKADPSATTAASASASASAAIPDDRLVCCKYAGVKGSATKKACDMGKGQVVPDSECPTLK